jgi:hypothetical protein
VYCYLDASWANGNYWTNRWFYVTAEYGQLGAVGYLHASLIPVSAQPRVPHC